jgi:hypothetical protein
MPRLPQIVQDQPLQGSGLSIGSAMAPGDAAARVGQDAANIGTEMTQRIIDVQRANQVMTKTAQGVEGAAKLYDQLSNDPSIPDDQLAQHVQDGLKILHDNLGADIKDRKVRELYDENFNSLTEHHVVNAIAEQRNRITSTALVGVDESNDTLAKRAVQTDDPIEHDRLIAQIHANTAGAVASKLLTAEQGHAKLDTSLRQVYIGSAERLIREQPDQAFSDLQDPEKFTELSPIERQVLTNDAWHQVQANANQSLANMRAVQVEQQRIRHENIGQVDSQLTLLASKGELTHQKVAEAVQQFNQPGFEPFPAERIEVLSNMINKPFEAPSDPVIRKFAEGAVTATIPTVTNEQLHNWYHTGQLDTQDYNRLVDKLTTAQHYQADQTKEAMRSREVIAEDWIRNRYGGAPLVYEQALRDLADSSAARAGSKDPLSLIDGLQKKYDPMLLEPGGPSVAKVRNEFLSSQKALETAQQNYAGWNKVHYLQNTLGLTNQYQGEVATRKEDLLIKARAAGMYLGKAGAGKPDGDYLDPVAGPISVVNGQVIKKK